MEINKNRLQIAALFLGAFLNSSLVIFIAYKLHMAQSKLGDYLFEIDRIFYSFNQGDIFNFYDQIVAPLMTPFSILLRAIFLIITNWLGLISLDYNSFFVQEEIENRYFSGAFIIVFFVSFLAMFVLRKRLSFAKTSLIGLFLVINPISLEAIGWGHPEEILFAGLIFISVVALAEKKLIFSAVCMGLALATKQPALLALPTIFFIVNKDQRVKFLAVTILTATVAVFPWVIFDLKEFLNHNLLTASGQDINNVRGYNLFSLFQASDYASAGKFLLFALAVALPATIAKRASWKISFLNGAVVLAIVFFFRGTLDTGNISYYMLPSITSLLLIDLFINRGRTFSYLPIFSLIGSVSFAVIMNGLIFNLFVDRSQLFNAAIFNALIILIITLIVTKTIPKETISRLSRKKIYVSLLAIISFSLILLIAFHNLHQATKSPSPLKGFINFTPKTIARYIDPKKAYWLGQKTSSGDPLNQSSALLRSPAIMNKPEMVKLTFLNYGENNLKGVVVITFNTTNKNIREKIGKCLRDTCPDLIKTKIGTGIITKNSWDDWHAVLQSSTGQYIYVNSTGTDYQPNDLMKDLQEIPSK